jgi:hypothetical protein
VLQFLHAGLLAGALLFTVPLLIHLLNRQRYRRRPWAAMEFLLNAYKKQRRRLRLENLLLLLLRCLIPIVLAFAIARPQLREIGLPALGGSSHHVLVCDVSYSMGAQPPGGQSPFDRMRALAGTLLERLEGLHSARVTLVFAGLRPQIPVQNDLSVSRARAALATWLGPQDTGGDLLPALLQVAQLVETGPEEEVRVYVFTDLQARAFGSAGLAEARPPATTRPAPPPAGEAPARSEPGFEDDCRDACERISKKADLMLLDCRGVGSPAGNLQITELRVDREYAGAGLPLPVVATVANLSDAPADVQVQLEIDGAEPQRKTTRVGAKEQGQLEFQVVLRELGQRRLRAALDGDNLSADNERFLVVPVRSRLRILLVEGSSETDETLQDASYVRRVLDPTGGEGAPADVVFAPKTIDQLALLGGREQLPAFDTVALCNVERLNEDAAVALRDAVHGGTGLFLMLGDRVDVDSYNLHLHGLQGDGPLPFRLLPAGPGYDPAGRQADGARVLRPEHPILTDVAREVFEQFPIWRHLRAAPGTLRQDAQLLAVVRDAEQSPLLTAGRFGQGRVLALTTPIHRRPERWNGYEFLGIAMPLLHQAMHWLSKPDEDLYQVVTGSPLATALRRRPMNVQVVLPERAGGGKAPVGDESKALPGKLWSLPPFLRTEHAGFYTVEMLLDQDGASVPHVLHFAVNVPPAEGELDYLLPETVKERLGVQKVLHALPEPGIVAAAEGGDLSLPLLYATLLLVLAEAGLAHYVQRRRS